MIPARNFLNKALVFTASFIFCAVSATDVLALDSELKRAIFSDCGRVESQIESLSVEHRVELAKYAGRVLKVETDAIAELVNELTSVVVQQNPPGGRTNPFEGFDDRQVWRTFAPLREEQAKQCAIKLLPALVPESAESLPDLLIAAKRATLADDIRRQLSDAIWSVAVAVRDSSEISDRTLEGIVRVWEEDGLYLAENVLSELHSRSLPLIAKRLRGAEPHVRGRMIKLLLRVDPFGAVVGPALLPLIESPDDDLRIRIIHALAELPLFVAPAFSNVVKRLEDPESAVSHAARATLIKIAEQNDDFIPGESECEILARDFEQLSQTAQTSMSMSLEPLILKCIRAYERFYRESLGELVSTIPEVRQRAVRLLGGLYDQGTYSSEVFRLLVNATSDPVAAVKIEALEQIGHDRVRAEEVRTVYTRTLRDLAKEREPHRRIGLIKAIARGLRTGEMKGGFALLEPYLSEVFGSEMFGIKKPENDGAFPTRDYAPADVIRQAGAKAVPFLLKQLRTSDAVAQQQSLVLLGEIEPTSTRTIRAAIPKLISVQRSVRAAAEDLLLSAGASREGAAEVEAELVRVLLSAKAPARIKSATPVIRVRGSKANKEDEQLAAATLLARILSSRIGGRVAQEEVSATDQASKEVRSKRDEVLLRQFLNALPETACRELAGLLSAFQMFRSVESNQQLQAVMACILDPNERGQELVRFLIDLQPYVDTADVDRQRLIENLVAQGGSTAGMVVVDLLREYEKYSLPIEFRLQTLTYLISSTDEMLRIHAIRALGELGGRAESIVPLLDELSHLENAEPLVRLHAAVAKLRIQPSDEVPAILLSSRIEGNAQSWSAALQLLSNEQLFPMLDRMIHHKSVTVQRRALATIQAMGERALEVRASGVEGAGGQLSPLILAVRDLALSDDFELAYEATLTLLNIVPEEAEAALRREFIGPNIGALIAREWSSPERGLVEAIAREPQSFTEQRTAHLILKGYLATEEWLELSDAHQSISRSKALSSSPAAPEPTSGPAPQEGSIGQ